MEEYSVSLIILNKNLYYKNSKWLLVIFF